MAFRCDTIETCEGTVCARCKINILACACNPARADFRARAGMTEQITGQGWMPETETNKRAA